jgi:hypothetical protein
MTPYGYPPEWYHCLLDEQPYYLVPSRLYGGDPAGAVIVNPRCWFSWHGPLPAEKAERAVATEHMLPTEWVVWVDDPATRSVWPYWVGAEYAHYLRDLVPGYLPPHELPSHVRWVLWRAHILVDPGFAEHRRRQWLDSAAYAAQLFERGYVLVPELIPAFHIGALRRYYRYHTRAESFVLGDDQVARRHVAHNEGLARFFHFQLAGAVSDIASTLVKPSYCYLAAYESGSVLDRHVDREQCEYSITVCIDATPEPAAQVPWPLQLDVADGALRIWQHLGDSLVYRGRSLPHYRDPLSEGYSSTSLLLHYVDRDYVGPLN